LERELGLKASLVEALRRDLEGVEAELRAEQARSRQLAEDNRRLRHTAGQSARPGSTTDGESCSSLFSVVDPDTTTLESGFNGVPGSGSERAKMTHKHRKVLDVLF
jgi:hypothetical protein